MKRILLASCVAMGLTLGGFAVTSMPARAAVVTNQDVSGPGATLNPCNGDTVTFSGTEHLLITSTTDSAGGTHVDIHSNFADVHGVGTDGTAYTLNARANAHQNVNLGAGEATVLFRGSVISHGSSPNYYFSQLFHVTQNANGEVTAQPYEFDTDCQG